MKILLINHYAGSIYHGMEFRPYYLSREWVKMGHEVTIVAASYSHLRQKNIEMSASTKEEYIDGIHYVWLKTSEYHGNGIGRIKNMLSFLRQLYRHLPAITKDFVPDAVIASSTYPLDSYPADWIAKKHGAKFVFELHDLWPMSPMVLGHMSKWHPFIMIMQRGEDYWCKNADLVVSLLPDAYKHLVTRGMSINKYVVIPNGVEPYEWDNKVSDLPEQHKSVIGELKRQGKFLVGYLGGHAISNGLDFLLEVALKLNNIPNIRFVLVGGGSDKEQLVAKSKKMQLANVTFLPPVRKDAVPKILDCFDVLTFGYKESQLGQYGTSENKFFDYMMAGKPIVKSSSNSNDFITDCGCGYSLPANDATGVSEKILEMSKIDKQALATMGSNGRAFVLQNYTYPVLAQKFIDALGGPSK